MTLLKNRKGIIVLTNQRVVWLDEKGILCKSYHRDFEIDLRSLEKVSTGGELFKYIIITDKVKQYSFNLKGAGDKELTRAKDAIQKQKENILKP